MVFLSIYLFIIVLQHHVEYQPELYVTVKFVIITRSTCVATVAVSQSCLPVNNIIGLARKTLANEVASWVC